MYCIIQRYLCRYPYLFCWAYLVPCTLLYLHHRPYTTSTKIVRVGVFEIGQFRTLGGEWVLGFPTSEILLSNYCLYYFENVIVLKF